MKKYSSLFFIATILAACNNFGSSASTSSQFLVAAPITAHAAPSKDTFSLGNKHFTIQPLSRSSFKKQEESNYDSVEINLLAKDQRVKRRGDSLLFTLGNGKIACLANNIRSESEDSHVAYFYAGYVPEINQYVAFAGYYEWSDYLLINASSGAARHVWGFPVVSPDKKHVICPSLDITVGFNENGLQLLTYQGDSLAFVGQATFKDWGFGQMKWLDNKTIEAEHVSVDQQMNETTKPVKLIME
jgi:hypothetical protein